MDADKRIVSPDKAPLSYNRECYLRSCVHLHPHSLRRILFQPNTGGAAHAYEKETDYLVEAEMRGLFGGPTNLQS